MTLPPKEKPPFAGAANKTKQIKSYQISHKKQGKTWVIAVIVLPVRNSIGGRV